MHDSNSQANNKMADFRGATPDHGVASGRRQRHVRPPSEKETRFFEDGAAVGEQIEEEAVKLAEFYCSTLENMQLKRAFDGEKLLKQKLDLNNHVQQKRHLEAERETWRWSVTVGGRREKRKRLGGRGANKKKDVLQTKTERNVHCITSYRTLSKMF